MSQNIRCKVLYNISSLMLLAVFCVVTLKFKVTLIFALYTILVFVDITSCRLVNIYRRSEEAQCPSETSVTLVADTVLHLRSWASALLLLL